MNGDSDHDENTLYRACEQRSNAPPTTEFRGMKYIGSGWEYSVFDDGQHVIKMPSNRFAEVNSTRYFANAQENYDLLRRYLGEEYLANTSFKDGVICQEKINDSNRVASPAQMKILCERLIRLLTEKLWLPDIEPQKHNFLQRPKNFLIQQDGTPKLIDFTAYYDVFRLSPDRLKREAQEKGGMLFRHLAILKL